MLCWFLTVATAQDVLWTLPLVPPGRTASAGATSLTVTTNSVALGPPDGEPRWTSQGEPLHGALIWDGRLAVLRTSGRLDLLDPGTGARTAGVLPGDSTLHLGRLDRGALARDRFGREHWRWEGERPVEQAWWADLDEDGELEVLLRHGDALTAVSPPDTSWMLDVVEDPRAPLLGKPVIDPLFVRCRDLDGHACMDAAQGREQPLSLWRRACSLGVTAGCSAALGVVGPHQVETGRRACVADASTCAAWLLVVAPEQRASAARLGCEAGAQELCDRTLPDPGAPLSTLERAVEVRLGTQSVAGLTVVGGRSDMPTDTDGVAFLRVLPGEVTLHVEHPGFLPTEHTFSTESRAPWVLPLTVTPLATGTVVDSRLGSPLDLEVTGCATGTVPVRAGRFQVLMTEPSLPCSLSATVGPLRWTGMGDVRGPITVRVDEKEPSPVSLHNLDGPLRDRALPGVWTGPEGEVLAATVEPCEGPGALEQWQGFRSTCTWFTHTVNLAGEAERWVLVGPTREVVETPGPVELQPGWWTAWAISADGVSSQRFAVEGARGVSLSATGLPEILVVTDPAGVPRGDAEVLAILDGEVVFEGRTDGVGQLRLPVADISGVRLRVDGTLTDVPGDGHLVQLPRKVKVALEASPFGLRVTAADEREVDLRPGDLLRTVCEVDARELADVDLRAIQAGRTCPVTVWRDGHAINAVLPP